MKRNVNQSAARKWAAASLIVGLPWLSTVASGLEAPFTRITTGAIATEKLASLSAACADINNDGWPDLFVANRDPSGKMSVPNSLFLNNGNGTFTKVTAGPVVTIPFRANHGVAFVDLNNDGWLDLVLGDMNKSGPCLAVFKGTGSGSYVQVSAADLGAVGTDTGLASGLSFADYDGDGLVDLFVAKGGLLLQESARDGLYHNEGNFRFTLVTNSPVVLKALPSTQGVWCDFDNDGDLDLFVTHAANKGNTLFRNDGQGQFVDITTAAGLGDLGDSGGAAWGDFDNDGFMDLLVANSNYLIGVKTRMFLYHNQGDGTFKRITTGDIATDAGFWLSASWVDYDNDGWLDLFVTQDSRGGAGVQNRLYHNQADGTFLRVSGGSLVADVSQAGHAGGAAWGDYDHDGFPDVFVCFGALYDPEPNGFYRNNGNSNAWISIKCAGTVSNRSAIGTRIRIKARIAGKEFWQARQIVGTEGWVSGNNLEALIGLGDATVIDTLRVEWPSGIVQEFHNLAVKQRLTVVESTTVDIRPQLAGKFELTVGGPRQQQYRLEASPDLSRWSSLVSLTITNNSGVAPFTYTPTQDEHHYFFRIVPE